MTERKKLLTSIKANTETLNNLADSATAELADVEKQLVEMGVGVEIWDGVIRSTRTVHNDDGYQSSSLEATHEFRLGFAKVDGKWGVAVNEYLQITEECQRQYDLVEDDVYLLMKAPRDVRIDALPHIDELLDEINKAIIEKTTSLAKK